MTTAEQAAEHNWQVFLEQGPRLSYRYGAYVLARRPGEVLLGGLGGMGMGQMWVTEEPRHRDYPGYEEAEVLP